MAAIKRFNDDNYQTIQEQKPVTALAKFHEESQASFDTLSAQYGTIYIYVTEKNRYPTQEFGQ
jgi:hypothetical protein